MFHNLKNEELFNAITQKKSVPQALLMSGNGKIFKELESAQLQEYDSLLKKRQTSLFELALEHGDFDAIEAVLNAGIKIPDDEASIKLYLHKLFVETGDDFGCSTSEGWKNSLYDKSPENILAIHHYLQEKVSSNNPVWRNSDTFNDLIVDSVNNRVVTLPAVLASECVTDVNKADSSGKTALYYLIKYANEDDHYLIPDPAANYLELSENLKKYNPQLSPEEQLDLTQRDFLKKINNAFILKNKEEILSCLKKLKENPSALTKEGINLCIIHAFRYQDFEILKALLNADHSNHIKLDNPPLQDALRNSPPELQYQLLSEPELFDTHDLFDRDNVFLTLKKLSHRIGVSGKIAYRTQESSQQRILDLEGDEIGNSLANLKDILQSWIPQNAEFQAGYEGIALATNAQFFYQNTQLASAADMFWQNYLDSKPLMLAPGWSGHGLGMCIQLNKDKTKTYISITNRGYGYLKACLNETAEKKFGAVAGGSIVYEVDGEINKLFIAEALKDFRGPADFHQFITEKLSNATPIAILPAEMQSHGTCSYVNRKRCLEPLLFIEAMHNNKPVNQETMDAVYNKYKAFSAYDKKQAWQLLIDYYKEQDANPGVQGIVAQFAIEAILQHQSDKNNQEELKLAKELFVLLPDTLKNQILPIVPHLQDTAISKCRDSLFSTERTRERKIGINATLSDRIKHKATLDRLINYLSENNITKSSIREIKIDGNDIIVLTISDPKTRDIVRDIFYNQLHATIQNQGNQFLFKVNNFPELKIPERSLKP